MLDGGTGADLLRGGLDADRLTGGAGNDIFAFGAVLDSPLLPATPRDQIMDFTHGEDRIRLEFDANTVVEGLQGFVLVAGAFANNRPGELRVQAIDATRCLLLGNTDADAAAEFAVLVRGVATLGVGDLLLA